LLMRQYKVKPQEILAILLCCNWLLQNAASGKLQICLAENLATHFLRC